MRTAYVLSAPEKRQPMKGNVMKHKMTEADIAAQIAQLVDMPDTDIDTADIPEAPIENWALAKRPGLYKPRKKPVTLRLDTDVVSWFKDHAQSGGYQTEINRVLRRYVHDNADRR
ncbi:BrnA antitoxin family protein [Sphingobium sp.]